MSGPGSSSIPPRDWDAATYDRVSSPQVEWARPVLDRLPLLGHETVLDAGCGSGRVTRLLLERLPRGRVVAVDAAESMVARARAAFADDPHVEVVQADLAELQLGEVVDAVFSNAVFHWIADHDALFARLHAALRPGGVLVAQCGGAGNIARFLTAMRSVLEDAPFHGRLTGEERPLRFASAEETAERLRQVGFEDVATWLEPWPTVPDDPRGFLRTVCLSPQLERLPPQLHDELVERVLSALGDPPELDYVRLNIDAHRPA